ncbi:MAG: serine/threonine protein kinase [Myxococcales bacterium]|nr:serine/threonine protein kinase [Myxococcales bacterium]
MPVEEELSPGTLLERRYRIERTIGGGASGTVYVAYHAHLKKSVALKVLSPRYVLDHENIELFRKEARLAAQLVHPNVVEILDLGQTDGAWFVVMELLDGQDLAHALLRRGNFSPEEMVAVLGEVLEALQAAHGVGLVHQNLKPENLFLARREGGGAQVKLLDLGQTRVARETALAQLIRRGTVVGTPEYMSPEQLSAGVVDARSDIYAAGCVAYTMLCGHPPFAIKNKFAVVQAQMRDPPIPPSTARPWLAAAEAIDRFVLRALEKDLLRRYQSAGEMRAALAELLALLPGESEAVEAGAEAATKADAGPRQSPGLPSAAAAVAEISAPTISAALWAAAESNLVVEEELAAAGAPIAETAPVVPEALAVPAAQPAPPTVAPATTAEPHPGSAAPSVKPAPPRPIVVALALPRPDPGARDDEDEGRPDGEAILLRVMLAMALLVLAALVARLILTGP